MKIKVLKKSYEEVRAMPKAKPFRPKKPNIIFRTLLKLLSLSELRAANFKCNKFGMDALDPKTPCLYLMNHSSFIDLEIVPHLLYPKPYNIVATTDSFIGKKWLMRQIGCIPTKKFVSDIGLVRDIKHTLYKLKSSVVMYPEASYSFDGTATPLPDSLGGFIKLLGVPVVMIRTYGAFSYDPLYNDLQKRRVDVSADMKYLLSPESAASMSADEINALLKKEFSFDHFAWQKENHIKIDEPFRADKLERVLYKCPHCQAEGAMKGEGTTICCSACGASYELDELGYLRASNVQGKFDHIPAWYAWERRCVREEIEAGTYRFESDVKILISRDLDHLYDVGMGHLTHDEKGFHLVGADGTLSYHQNPQASYSLYSDFFWYELGDIIAIGDREYTYYCFPPAERATVAKARLATEELYLRHKLERSQKS